MKRTVITLKLWQGKVTYWWNVSTNPQFCIARDKADAIQRAQSRFGHIIIRDHIAE
jgi:hypothetical protein